MTLKLRFLKIISFCLLLPAAPAFAGTDHAPAGARAAGLAGAAATISDVWAMHNNVAGIAALDKHHIGVWAENRFQVKAFTTVGAMGTYSLGKAGVAGLELSRFGDQLYNEQRAALGFGHKLGFVSLGVKAELLQVQLEEFGSKKAVLLSFGGQAQIVKELVFGAHIYNLNQAKLADFQDERVPTVLKAGLSYRPLNNLMLNVETEKSIELDAEFKAGAEYLVLEKLSVRAGFSSLTETVNFGLGWRAGAFQVDYSLGTQQVLGLSNHLSVSYQFPGK